MDSSSKILKNASSGDDVMLSFDNLSLNEVLTNEALCLQKCIATEGFHQNLQPDIISNKTCKKTKASVKILNEITSPTQDCALTILDDSCCPDTNSNSFLNSTYVVPDGTASSARDSINAKIDFVLRRNSRSNSHQQPNSSDCVITLYESSDSDTSINDSESSLLLHSECADGIACSNENELSYAIKRTSLASEGETTEEYSNDSEDSSDCHQDSDDSSDSDSDSDSVSINDDSDEEPNPSNDEESEDSDDDSSTTSEDKPDSDDESEQNGDESSDESDDSSDDDKSVDLDEASESSSESSEESD